MSTASLVANAYAAAARAANSGDYTPAPLRDTKAGFDDSSSAGFSAMLENTLANTIAAGRASDHKAQALIAGKADIVDVVTAVAETEVAIESMVSIRDKVIQAYQEIMQMPI
ncbi:flagellar hook-basal body complex protein FliE [Blastochloris viridis]|uniref:Flagellar hook-basal body complex protein FliE n=2 Tax=Blastochloris viridis TaxID=1079 RepID=A0A0P0IY45_BLAVI|nr:flagellar hook-basal body complex protein FliE [Blastochloris viridis]ALK08799.1 Flagellar hook-basal body complex protein FliE [Blastochloris viridis]CUU41460.1 flagellar hook-basal body protein FliE [Blastochloris viridis]